MRSGFLSLCFLFLTCIASEAQVLKADEITAAVLGKQATWNTKDGKISGNVACSTNGTCQITGNFGKFNKDTGTWRFKGNQFCNTWRKIRDGKERCFEVTKLPDGSLDMGT